MLIIFKLGMCEDLKKALVQLSANVLFSFSFFLSFFLTLDWQTFFESDTTYTPAGTHRYKRIPTYFFVGTRQTLECVSL